MKGLHDFIIELKTDFNETFKTENGVELYGNKDLSPERMSNRVAKVVNTPILHETEIQKGFEILIDPSILYKQIYREVKQESIHLMDKEKGYYKLDPKEIVLFRKDSNSEWKGYLNNSLVEPIKEDQDEIKSSLIIMPKKSGYKKGRAKAFCMNDNIDVKKGQELLINNNGGVPFWIDGKEYWWIRNIDIYATVD